MVFFLLVFSSSIISCSSDDPTANITVNEGPNGDIGGDFTGDGGDAVRTISWSNSLATADYNADITSTASGTFNLVVRDAVNEIVLNRSLVGGSEPDSFSGVTSAGEPGTWTVTITITSFNGDGSYSLSAGN